MLRYQASKQTSKESKQKDCPWEHKGLQALLTEVAFGPEVAGRPAPKGTDVVVFRNWFPQVTEKISSV